MLQSCEQGGEQQSLLRLPHIFPGVSLGETILDELIELVLLNLAACFCNQDRRHILQHDRLQRKAAPTLPSLDQGASPQTVDGFQQHLVTRQGGDHCCEQFIEGHWLTHNRQPTEHRLLLD